MIDQSKPTLYLVRGVSGAGKSTFAQSLLSVYEGLVVHLEADMYFMQHGSYNFQQEKLHQAHQWCQSNTRSYLARNWNTIVSNTSTTEKEVKVYQDIAKECNANFVSLIVENRSNTISLHNVPEEVLRKQRNRFSVKL